MVSDVTPDSPAARSGLKSGDVILEVNGAPIADSRQLSLKISQTAPGTTVKLTVFRDGQQRGISVALAELPAKPQEGGESSAGAATPHLGISVEGLTAQPARRLGLPPSTTGVAVVDVQPGSAAEEAGIRRGDVIQQANRRPVTSVEEFQRAIRQGGNQPVLLYLNRHGDHLFLVVTPR